MTFCNAALKDADSAGWPMPIVIGGSALVPAANFMKEVSE